MMINHIHAHIICHTEKDMIDFVKLYSSIFVTEYNKNKKRTGPLMKRGVGWASKSTAKDIMTSIAYLGNNAVLKKLCTKAEKYMWCFLAYAINKNPFSTPLVIRRASPDMTRSIAVVKSYAKRNRYLNYAALKLIFTKLANEEKRQLIDFIIVSYNVINYNKMISFYGNYDKMILAINSNSGSEYQIKEDWDGTSDKPFFDMMKITDQMGYGGEHGYNFQKLKESELQRLAKAFYHNTKASARHISKFLHIEMQYAKRLINS